MNLNSPTNEATELAHLGPSDLGDATLGYASFRRASFRGANFRGDVEFEGDAPDPLAEAGPRWVTTAPVREHLFFLSQSTDVPWFVLLEYAGWPSRLAQRMGLGPIPKRVPKALADALVELQPADIRADPGRIAA